MIFGRHLCPTPIIVSLPSISLGAIPFQVVTPAIVEPFGSRLGVIFLRPPTF